MSRRYLTRGAWTGHVLVFAAALTCLRLGWWQWQVSQDPAGTLQNLGYAFLWPVIAGSFIYMWLRLLHLAAEQDAAGREAPNDTAVGSAAVDGAPLAAALVRGPAVGAIAAGAKGDGGAPRVAARAAVPPAGRRSAMRTVGVGYVGGYDDDSELAAYNRALAALAEQDEQDRDS